MIAALKIQIICPAPRRSRKGNRVTAERWAGILDDLGHRVIIRQCVDDSDCDMLVALHARRSAWSIQRFARLHPRLPLIVALTGTDLYRDIQTSRRAQRSLDLATRLVVLQARGLEELKKAHRAKAHVILQSAEPTPGRPAGPKGQGEVFRVCVLGHLRYEKDPLRCALATRLIPASSRVRVTHLGEALRPFLGAWAKRESSRNPRYQWHGEVSPARARRVLAASDLMVLSSRMEGGANVLSEALADGVPVIASRISGNVGILGEDYPGYYPTGNTARLAQSIRRAETDPEFYAVLSKWCRRLAPRFTPAAERSSWERLLREIRKLQV